VPLTVVGLGREELEGKDGGGATDQLADQTLRVARLIHAGSVGGQCRLDGAGSSTPVSAPTACWNRRDRGGDLVEVGIPAAAQPHGREAERHKGGSRQQQLRGVGAGGCQLRGTVGRNRGGGLDGCL
jgi:hypothetical protein